MDPFAVPDGTNFIVWKSTDNAGNVEVVGSSKEVKVDTQIPTVSTATDAVSSDGQYFNAGTHTITVKFSEPLTTAPQIAIDTAGTIDTVSATPMLGTAPTDTWTYDYTITQPSSDGTATITLTDGTDVAGNVMASDSSHKFVIDTTAPASFTVGGVTASGGNVVSGKWNSTNTALKVVVPVDSSDSSLIGGNIQLQAQIGSGSFVDLGSSVNIDNSTGNTTTISIQASTFEALTGFADGKNITLGAVITDNAGNSTTGTPSDGTIYVDQTAPTLSTVGITSENSNSSFAKVGDKITVNITADEDIQTLTVTIGGNSALVTGSGASWAATYTMQSSDSERVVPFAIDFSDVAGNSGIQVTNTTDSSTVTFDKTKPTVSTATDAVSSDGQYFNAGTHTITVKFSEPLTTAPQIAIDTAGTIDTVSATPMLGTAPTDTWTYDYTITQPSSDGTATITLTDGADAAGNVMVSNGTHTFVIDTTNPTIPDFLSPGENVVYHNSNPTLIFTPTDASLLTCSYTIDSGSSVLVSCTSGGEVSNTISNLTDGRHIINLTVTDEAGNTVSRSVSFVYDIDGILTVAKTGTPDFATIQGAIDASVDGITTIDVAAGTYDEQVVINKSLTLQGAGNTTIIKPSQATASAFQLFARGTDSSNKDTAPIIGVNTNGETVNIHGFKIDGSLITSTPSSAELVGIFYRDTSGVIANMDISGINIHNGGGMYLVGHDATSVSLEVKDNVVSDYLKNGITANYPDMTANIHDNTVTGMGPTTSIAQNGIQIGFGATGKVKNNTVKDNVWTGIYTYSTDNNPTTDTTADGAAGILLYHTSGTVEVSGNTLTNNQFGVWSVGSNAVNIHNNDITGLAHTGNAYPTGIAVWSADQWFSYFGYNEFGTTGSINNNTINSNDYGILVRDYTTGNTTEPSITASENNIAGNVLNGAWSNSSFNAEKNWWGDKTGPENDALNPSGIGSSASDNIDFSPFCTDVPVNDGNGTNTFTCTLVSIDPIASFDLSFGTNPQEVNHDSTLTVTAKDASDYTVVNDSSTKLTLIGDNGASFGLNLLTMGALGSTATTITNTIAGWVNVTATEVGGTATGANTIEFTATPVVQPTLILDGDAIASPYTVDQATSRFTNGLQFDVTNAISATVNGTSVTVPTSGNGALTAVTSTGAVTLGLHLYTVKVTSSTGNTVTKTVGYQVNANTVTPITPTIALYGDAIASPYTATEAGARFTDGLQFTLTGAASVTVNGISATLVGDANAATTTIAGATTLGLHVYNVVVTSPTGNFTNITVAYNVNANTITPIIPTLILNGDPLLTAYTSTQASARFVNGLQFETTGVESTTVNGVATSVDTDGTTLTVATPTDASALGYHAYNVIVTSSTGDTVNVPVMYIVFNDIASLGVTRVTASSTMATVGSTFENGWSWVFDVTVPTNETDLSMKFKDFKTSDGVNIIPADGNIRFYSPQSSDANSASTAMMIDSANTFAGPITLNANADMYPTVPGRQVQVVVEMKVPTDSAEGLSYSSSYAFKSEAPTL